MFMHNRSRPKSFHSARERRSRLTRSASGDAPADGRVLLGEKDMMRTRLVGWRARGEEQPPREVGPACGRPARARIGHRDLFGRTPPPRPLASPLSRPLPSLCALRVPCTQGAEWGSQFMSVAGLESVLTGGIGGQERRGKARGRRMRGALHAHPSEEVAARPLLTRMSKKIRHNRENQLVVGPISPIMKAPPTLAGHL